MEKIEALKLEEKKQNLNVRIIGPFVTLNIRNFQISKYWSFEVSTPTQNPDAGVSLFSE